MTNLKKLTNQIVKLENKLKELKLERQQICSHEIVKRESYCEDDYAYIKKYVISYECTICGLYATNRNENENYIKLQNVYYKEE